jgi:superfamily II DNA/RNA helicase
MSQFARSVDVISSADDFSQLCLSAPILRALKEMGLLRPSPIQLKAIPVAKSGVGLFLLFRSVIICIVDELLIDL